MHRTQLQIPKCHVKTTGIVMHSSAEKENSLASHQHSSRFSKIPCLKGIDPTAPSASMCIQYVHGWGYLNTYTHYTHACILTHTQILICYLRKGRSYFILYSPRSQNQTLRYLKSSNFNVKPAFPLNSEDSQKNKLFPTCLMEQM